ncbi:transposase [Colwellia sp. TT2012]|uniref:transposase n=1 Tax=Colwellia sp. TT2012 TaxID=1720342 RepID=UPI00070AB76B|nr:transposase [Colwellia sp. TT2012]
MPRKSRVSLAGVAEHVIQRGNNRQAIFACENDMKVYVTWLKQYSKKYKVAIHAWVLMTNHVHILCSPANHSGISQMMQSLGRMYVMYFNRAYKRSGTLWEGRYRSCLVQSEQYLLELYRYIELNPVRAGMVQDPSEYSWSSYQCNALGKQSDLLTAHPNYLAINQDANNRLADYRKLFAGYVESELIEDIRKATNKGLALGNEQFKFKVEALSGRSVIEGKRGRPIGWKKAVDVSD